MFLYAYDMYLAQHANLVVKMSGMGVDMKSFLDKHKHIIP